MLLKRQLTTWEEAALDVQELINRLTKCTGPDRALDGYIAMQIGFQKRIERFMDSSGAERNRTIWLVPSGNDIARIPQYTGSLEDAFQLALAAAPDRTGGVSWADGKGTAIINDGEYHQAATPALALCIAAMAEKAKRMRD